MSDENDLRRLARTIALKAHESYRAAALKQNGGIRARYYDETQATLREDIYLALVSAAAGPLVPRTREST